jgi:hypothetical protein
METEQYLDIALIKKDPLTTSTGSSFDGEVSFVYDIGSNKILFTPTIRLNAEVSVGINSANQYIHYDNGTIHNKYDITTSLAIANSIIGYVQDIENAFSKCKVYLNETIIYSLDSYNYAEKLFKICFNLADYEYKYDVGVNEDRDKGLTCTITTAADTNFQRPISIDDEKEDVVNHIIRMLKKEGLNRRHIFSLSAVLNIPLFEKLKKLYGSSILKFSLYVDPEWRALLYPFVQLREDHAANAAEFKIAEHPDKKNLVESFADGKLSVSIKNLYMTAQMAVTNIPMHIENKKSVLYDSYTCTIDNISPTGKGTRVRTFISCEPSVDKVIVSYIYNSPPLNDVIPPINAGRRVFSTGGIYYGLFQPPISGVRLKYAEVSFPANDDYVFDLSNSDESQRDNMLLYELYKMNFYAKDETVPTYHQWLFNGSPFVFPIKVPTMTRSNGLEVFTTLNASIGEDNPLKIIVICLYKNVLTYEYNNGELKIDSVVNAV